jgi:predicted dehydrogenase
MPSRLSAAVSRRTFLRSAAALSSLAAMPASSWARVLGSNDRLTMGVIGTGGMGTAHAEMITSREDQENVVITRVCDVSRRRLNHAVKVIKGDSNSGTMEYREVLDDKSVDCVLIATPDHWHTKIAIEAMDAGKDVYCEKPLSLTIEQALECRDAVKRTGRVLQVGPQYTSSSNFWNARDAIGRGRIGKPVWSQGAYCRNSTGGQFNWQIDPDAGPDAAKDAEGYVWWDRWLGSEWGLAEKIPWNADHFFRFRKYFAYNGGVATDLLYHKLSPLLLAISGPNGEYPRKVVASGGTFLEKDERDIPDTFMMMVDYPSEHTIVLVSVMTNDVGLTTMIRGQYGSIEFKDGAEYGDGGRLAFTEQGVWADKFREANRDLVTVRKTKHDKGEERSDPANGEAAFDIQPARRRAAGGTTDDGIQADHVGNFLDSIRGKAKPDCNVNLGASTMVAIKMGVEAYRRNKVMMWDAAKERAYEA